jgi:hypothetical protein
MSGFLNSRWFNIVKAGIFAAVMFLVQQDSTAEVQKASGQPVSAIDLPGGVIEVLGAVYAYLQVGQKRPA